MESQELRIGNWVNKNGKHFEIEESKHIGLFFEYEPIELTEEILLKIPNIKEQEYNCVHGNLKGWSIETENSSLDIVLFDGNFCLYTMTDDVYWGYVENEINYLHDLQNVFYFKDNKKEELEIDLS